MANGKREFVAQHVTRFFPLLVFNSSFLLQKISSFELFYLLIFYFEKFSTRVCRLP